MVLSWNGFDPIMDPAQRPWGDLGQSPPPWLLPPVSAHPDAPGPGAGTAKWWPEDQVSIGPGLDPSLRQVLPALLARAMNGAAPGVGGESAGPGRPNPAMPSLLPPCSAREAPGALPYEDALGLLLLAWLLAQLPALGPGRDLGDLSRSPSPPAAPAEPRSAAAGGPPGAGSGAGAPAGPPASPPGSNLPPGTGGQGLRIQVIGDSLMVGASQATREALGGAGADAVHVDAEQGRAIDASGAGVHVSPEQIRQQVEASGANVVVLELGSNHADYARFIPRTMDELTKIQPPPMVVWVNTKTRRPPGAAYGPDYYQENARINELIAAEAARRPTMVVADWASIAGRPGMNAGDGLHLTRQGNQALADLIQRTIAAARAG